MPISPTTHSVRVSPRGRGLAPHLLASLLGSVLLLSGCPPRAGDDDDDDSAMGDDDDMAGDDDDAASEWSEDWAAFEAEVLRLTNNRRAARADCGSQGVFPAVGALTMQDNLQEAARLHALGMATRDYVAHDSPEGVDMVTRVTDAGYSSYMALGENVAGGSPTPGGVVMGWMNSDGHCANIMNASFTELGVGYAYQPGTTFGHYWVQNFGRR